MNKKQKNKRTFSILPESTGAAIAMLAVLFVEIFFMMFVIRLDILPAKYMIALIGGIVLIDIIVFKLLNCRKTKTNKRIAGVICSILLINILVVGCYYLYSTFDTLLEISEQRNQTEQYHVITLKDGSYTQIGDIAGKDVYVVKMESKMYDEAKEKLLTEVEVNYKTEKDMIAVSDHLLTAKGKTSDEIIYISNANYDMICEEKEDFKDKTQILYSVAVEIKTNDEASSVNVTEDPFNIYISGIDVWGTIDQVSRSDVNMIMTVNPKTREILLTSIPRDSYVELHSFGAKDKLTHSGIYGVDETIKTVEDWMGINIDYYVRANFSMVTRLVDAIGGIDVVSDYAFKSKVSEYTYDVGENHLDGKAALYFARERKAFKESDEQRIKNQQIVLEAILKKITQSKVILTRYTSLLEAVEGRMQTNLSDKEIYSLVKMQLKDMSAWTIKKVAIDGTGAMGPTYSMGSRELFVSVPKQESVDAAVKKMHDVMYPVEDVNDKEQFLLK